MGEACGDGGVGESDGEEVEGGGVEGAVVDAEDGSGGGGGSEEVGESGDEVLAGDGWEHGGAAEVVVAVALDVRDAEGVHDGEVLEEGDGADVGEVFAAEDGTGGGGGGEVGEPLDETFAVFVASPGVAEGEGSGEGIEGGVGFVDDDGRVVVPCGEALAGGVGEGVVAVERLFDEEETLVEPAGEGGLGVPVIPVVVEDADVGEVFVGVEREAGVGREDGGEAEETMGVGFEVAAEFDFEVGEVEGADVIGEGVGEIVVGRGSGVGGVERVGETDRVADG